MIKRNFPDEYSKFLVYRERVESITPNLKQLYYDWLDGKVEEFDIGLIVPEFFLDESSPVLIIFS